jgi:pimeloyl-ACP methyl ester carboxylesterase
VIPETRYARTADGYSIAYQILGDGGLDLAYLPGFASNLEYQWENPLYARFLRQLASFSRLILIDRRGTGLSDRVSPKEIPPIEVLMDDLGVVLDEAGSRRGSAHRLRRRR